MKKDILKIIIKEEYSILKKFDISGREYLLEPKANYVFCGVRRCGKSYRLYNEIHRLNKKKIPFVFINFEDERFVEFKVEHFNLIIEAAQELYGECKHFFFDEIHNIHGWEKFVRRLADAKYHVYVSGSNAKMLSKEIGSVLGGRYMTQEVFPLSFREFLSFRKVSLEKDYEFSEQRFKIKQLFEAYFYYGGFPELIHFNNAKEYLSSIYMKVLFGDIIARNGIQNEKVLRLLVKKLAESVNNETSINRIRNLIISTGAKLGSNTLQEYLEYLKDAYLIFPLHNVVSQFAEREAKKKYYFVDQGVLNLFLLNQNSKLLENIVFLHLYKQFGEGLFYYKRNYEVDFCIPSEGQLIQVCYSIDDPETRKRELKALMAGQKELNAKKLMIISYDEEEVIEHKGFDIPVVPVWKWLLKS